MRLGGQWPQKYELKSLRLLGSVGEPINPEAWMWYREIIGRGRCPIVDTWWQTETGAILISPLPGAIPTKPGSATKPLPGIIADVVNREGQWVAKEIGPIAKPDDIRFTDALPKTRSGKIMRRLLREIATNGEVKGDTTTLEDFSVLTKLSADEE